MKKRMLWCMSILTFLCMSCKSENISHTKISDTNIQTSGTDESQTEPDIATSNFSSMQIYKCVTDPDTKDTKYGLFLDEPIEYTGEEISIKADICMEFIDLDKDYTDIPALMLLALNGQLIQFSLDGDEYAPLHQITLQNAAKNEYILHFFPTGAAENSKNTLTILTVPFYQQESTTPVETIVASYSKELTATQSCMFSAPYTPSTSYHFAGIEDEYGISIMDICEYHGTITDFLFFHNGSLKYIGEYEPGSYITFLFCDGSLYSGFNGNYYLKWTSNAPEYVHADISTDGLVAGNHTFFTLTLIDSDTDIPPDSPAAYKSQNYTLEITNQQVN